MKSRPMGSRGERSTHRSGQSSKCGVMFLTREPPRFLNRTGVVFPKALSGQAGTTGMFEHVRLGPPDSPLGFEYRRFMRLFRPRLWTLPMAIVALVGCSNSTELRSSDQSTAFIAAVARGASAANWRLAPGATRAATLAWAERDALSALGRALRREGNAWSCEFAEEAGQLHSIGRFTRGDREAVTTKARELGVARAKIDALLHEVLQLADPDLVRATNAVCRQRSSVARAGTTP
jgi:transposase